MFQKTPHFMRHNFMVALDDCGQRSIRLPTTESFLLGGILFPSSELQFLRKMWMDHLDLSPGAEVKIGGYLERYGHVSSCEPTVNGGAILGTLLEQGQAVPVFVHTKKSDVSHYLTIPSRKGGVNLDITKPYCLMAVQLTGFLRNKKIPGNIRIRVVSDRLSSEREESQVQKEWLESLEVMGETRVGKIHFVCSKQNPEIQIAGVLMGLLKNSARPGVSMGAKLSGLVNKAREQNLVSFHFM